MQHVWVEPLAAPHRKMSLILRPGQQLNLKDVARLLGFDPEAPLRLHLANNTVSEIPMAGQVTVNWPLEDLQILTGRAGCETAPFLLQDPGMDAAQNSEPGEWMSTPPPPPPPPPPPRNGWTLCKVTEPCTISSLQEQVCQSACRPFTTRAFFLPICRGYSPSPDEEDIPTGLLCVKVVQSSTPGLSLNLLWKAAASYQIA